MTKERAEDYVIESGPMGPIGEGHALILRVNRNCPWNKCLFCPVYKGMRFGTRSLDEIKCDIDAVRRTKDLLEKSVYKVGLNGGLTKEGLQETVNNHPEIYGMYPGYPTQQQWSALQTLGNVANWMLYGAKRVFLQDANALAMKPAALTQVLHYLKEIFPTVNTVTCYARSKTCERRSLEELTQLKEAGLSWCFVGIESGCNPVLDYMKKGVSMEEHIKGGQKLMDAGIHMAAFVMPGLAGNNMKLAERHMMDTITVLNEIRPTEVRVRSLAVLEETPLYERCASGEFLVASEDQMIDEVRMLVEGLHFDCTFETLQMTNSLFTAKGKLSETRSSMQKIIHWYQTEPPAEKARFLLNRYLEDGYLGCVKAWGKYDTPLEALIEDAKESIAAGREDALTKTERAIFAIRSKGVP